MMDPRLRGDDEMCKGMSQGKQNPAVGVIGPGAIGTFIASRIAQTGQKVLLIGRDERWLSYVRKHGIAVSSGESKRAQKIKGVLPVVRPSGRKCDALFFCVKAEDTSAAIRRARPFVGPETTVVSLQNGLTHRAPLLAAFGRKRTVFGVCYIGAERLGPSRVHHHGGSAIGLALHHGNASAVKAAQVILSRAGFKVATKTSEDDLLWEKAVFNAATNPLGALTGRANGQLVDVGPLRELTLRALKEGIAVANAAGHALSYPRLKHYLLEGLRSMPDQPNSMLQDLRAGRPTEIDAIVKPLLTAARRKGVKTPLLDSLCRFTLRLSRNLRLSKP